MHRVIPDEGSIDLQLVELNALQIAAEQISRAKITKRQSETQLPDRNVGPTKQRRLRDFQLKVPMVEFRIHDGHDDLVHHFLVGEPPSRQID